MIKNTYSIIGVMSGTSLDGMDLVLVTLYKGKTWNFILHYSETVPYSKVWKKRLKNGFQLTSKDLKTLDFEYTLYVAKVISSFIQRHQIKNIDAVCSHGHTILHQPEKGLTLQIGNLPELSDLIGLKVVCDFRKQDVALGGQGAPLVPVGDALLFSQYDYCLNLGGFANASTKNGENRIAYDICPVNIVMNPLAEKLGFSYDDQGKIASKGNLLPQLLKQLNALPFYQRAPPKSLGLEWVIQEVFPLMNSEIHSVPDLLRTFSEHVAMQLAANFSEGATIFVTGGGAFNLYLLKRLKYHKKLKIIIPENEIIEYKEALIFGLLGVLKLRGENNCLASVTGAKKDHSSGVIFQKNKPIKKDFTLF
ncbi:MAG: anhydro-N-acetylmuramic acid kinase [Bacteroidetes bacterium HGW-Bacteroidetes-2]|jgi:anhydro-N-acetylmuramic acid kinase|nr:MAG: anhydro-N-acetylmuramic acid kinase [Bacteroidetes bacterium HGW-Bacteroidetes-2]